MAIRLKIARTAKELDDVFRLRHEVFVEERGKFSDVRGGGDRVVDQFDTLPDVANVVAYHGERAVASLRVNKDSYMGLPSEEFFDFSATRSLIADQDLFPAEKDSTIVSGSMLAVHKEWRNRRSVVFALFKTAIGVMHSWGATHVFAAISEESRSLYGRLGFTPVGSPEWKESVGDTLLPLMAPFDKVYDWAFGRISTEVNYFWLDNFCAQFERLLLSPGEVLFQEGQPADRAYAVDEGWVSISRTDPTGHELVLANLSRGALFGELAIFDNERRRGTARTLTNAEVIAIEKKHMMEIVRKHPEKLDQLLAHFARRIRETDDLAMVQAFAPETRRVMHSLNDLWQSAAPDRKKPKTRAARVGPAQLARTAKVRETEVRRVLEMKRAEGWLEYGEHVIRFLQEPTTAEVLPVQCESPV